MEEYTQKQYEEQEWKWIAAQLRKNMDNPLVKEENKFHKFLQTIKGERHEV